MSLGVLVNNEEVFRQELELLKEMEVSIYKARPVSYAMKKEEKECDRIFGE